MIDASGKLREKLVRISQNWISQGLPSRQVLEGTVDDLDQWKQRRQVKGIWPDHPLIITATLDDGIGQGISIIERYAGAIGLQVQPIGLLQPPGIIVDKCRHHRPAFLGLTILQLDSETDLAQVGHQRPQVTRVIAGGPVFRFDPEMGERCNVDFIAPNVAYFLDYLLKLPH